MADAGEPALGTDPLKRDTDEGGVADGREVENRTDPRNPRDDGTVGAEVIDRFRPDRLLVRFSRDLAKGELERITEDLQLRLRFRSRGSGLYELELPAGADFEQTLKRLNSIQGPSEHGHGAERLAYAVPEFLGVFEWAPSTQAKEGKSVRVVGPGAAEAPSDPRFAAQTGFAELAEAWQVEQGSRDKRGVVVAIIDSGLDVRHEDIQDNLSRNEDEGPGDLNRDGCPVFAAVTTTGTASPTSATPTSWSCSAGDSPVRRPRPTTTRTATSTTSTATTLPRRAQT